jgi:exoribonuclease R
MCYIFHMSHLHTCKQAQDRAALRELTANLNDRHRNAQFAGRASAELHTLIFFTDKALAADARIVKVTHCGLQSFLPVCLELRLGFDSMLGTCYGAGSQESILDSEANQYQMCAGAHQWLHRVRAQVRNRGPGVPGGKGRRRRRSLGHGRGDPDGHLA